VKRITARGRPCLVLVDEKMLSMIWVPLIMVPDSKQAFFYLDVAYISHMLQEYVPIVLGVSVLCCSKCFHVIFKKMFSCCKLQVFYLDVAYISHTCFKRMF
jgi:hypothetical protein